MARGKKRIKRCLDKLSAEGRTALVPFFSVGDPGIDETHDAVLAAVDAGADIIELGVPFSDPMADGPVIQASSQRALEAGTSLHGILEMVASLRARTDVPLVLFGYYNPFFHYGEEAFALDAASAGADGVLCVDLPPEEARGMVAACRSNGMDRIFLLAPTSDDSRIEAVSRCSSGFVYFVSVTGVTGARSSLSANVPAKVARVRELCDLPVGVGFGISTPEQAHAVADYADLVIVGSALVKTMHEAGAARCAAEAGRFVSNLRRGIDG